MAAKQVAPDRQNPAQKQEKPSATQEAAPKARAVPDLSGPISPARARGAQGVAGNDAVSRAVGPKGPATGGKASGGDAPPKANGGPGGPGGLGGAVQAAAGFVMRAAGAGRAAPAMNGDGPPRGGGDGAAAPNGGGGGAGGPVDLGTHQAQRVDAPSGGGTPLASGVRGQMEGAFGVDFGGVRVHVGADSEKLTAQVGADALTMGADIHFGKGKFDPGSQGGQKLLAHELTHVVQQGGGSPRGGSEKGPEDGKSGPKVKGRTGGKKRQPKLTIGGSGDAHEAEADRVAGQVVSGGQAGAVGGASAQVSRKASAGKGGGAKGAIEGFVALKPSQRARQWTGLSGQVNVGLQADVQTTNEGKPEIHARLGVGVTGATKGAPEGAPKKPAEGKGAEVQGPAKDAGNVPKAPQPTLTQIPALTRPAPVVSVPKDATPEQGQAAAQRAFAGISTNANLNTTAGARPKVPRSGDADPSKAETRRKEATQEADTARNKAKQEVEQGRGTEVVKDLLMDQVNKVKDTVADAMKDPPPVEGMEKFKEKGLPPDVEAKFDEQQQAVMEASLADARSQVDEASAKKETDEQAEFEKAKAESEKLSQAAQAEHDAAVHQARGDITKAREETKAEQDKAYADLDKETQARHKDELSAIDAKVSSTESQIEGEFTKAESQANQEVRKAEQEAAQKKKEEEEKAKNRSWWDSVKDAVSSVFDAIASAITKVLNAVRELVKGILDKVKTWATSIIDAATTWITDRIKQFAGWLKERVTQIVGAVFPKLAAKLNQLIDQAADWACKKVQQIGEGLKKAVTDLCDTIGAALDKIIALYQQALDMALAIMEAALTGDWAALGMKVLEAVLALAGIPKEEFMAVVGQGEETIDKIVDDPGGFLGNMIDAVGQGFGQFSDNFLSHLQNGFLEWLTKTASAAGVATLGSMELGDIFGWVLETLGVDKGYIRGKAVKVLGEDNVERVEWVMDVIGTAMEGGWDGLWEYMQGYVDGFYDLVIGQIQEFVMTRVIQAAVIKIASMFNPVGAIVQAIITAWNVYEFLRDQIQRIFGVVKAVVGSMHDLAFGNIGGAANMIEGALGKLVPIAIDLLAKVLGLGGIPEKVSGIIGKVREKIDGAIDKVIEKIKAGFKKGADWIQGKGSKKEEPKKADAAEDKKGEGKPGDASKAGDVASLLEKPEEFTAGGEGHKVWFTSAGGKATLMVASTPLPWSERIQRWREELKKQPEDKRKEVGSAIGKAIAIEREAVKVADAAIKSKDPADAAKANAKKAEIAPATADVFNKLPATLQNTENVIKAITPFKVLPAGVDDARASALVADPPEKIRASLYPDFNAFSAAAAQLGGTGAEKLRQIDTEEGLENPGLKATAKTDLLDAYHKKGGADLFMLMQQTLGTDTYKQKGLKLSKADIEAAVGADKTLGRGMGIHAFQRGGILDTAKLKKATATQMTADTGAPVAEADVTDEQAFAFFKKQLTVGAPAAISTYVKDGTGLVNPKYAGWFCPEQAIKSDAVFSQVIDGMALFADWYTEGMVTFKLTKSGLDDLAGSGAIRKPTVFDGLLSPLWSQRDNRDHKFGVTGGNVREAVVQARWSDVDQGSWRALPMDSEYAAVVAAAKNKQGERLSTDQQKVDEHNKLQVGKFKETNAGLNAAQSQGKPSTEGVTNLPENRVDQSGTQPKLNASVLSKYSSGPAPSDWQTREVRSVPSANVVNDDPGHTYHILDDGTVVSTSTPQVVKSDIATKTVRVAGLSLADLKKKSKSPKDTLKDSGEMSAEELQKMEGALKKNPRSEEQLDAATKKTTPVAKSNVDASTGKVIANDENSDGSKRAPMSEDEKAALLKGHAILAKDVKEGADMRKVIPNNQVGQMLTGQSTMRGAENLGGSGIRGSVGHQRNTDGMNAEQTVAALGLDYEHKPNVPGKAPKPGQDHKGSFTDLDRAGNVKLSKDVENKGLHYVDFKMTKEMEKGSGVLMSQDLVDKGSTSKDADVRAMALKARPQEKQDRDDPFAATGATSSNGLVQKGGPQAGQGFAPVLNQEHKLDPTLRDDRGANGKAGFELPEGSEMKKRGNRAGEDKTIATLKQKRDDKGEVVYDSAGKPILDWELNRELEKQERGSYKNMMDKAKSDAKATAQQPGEDNAAYDARMADRKAKIAASQKAEEDLATGSGNPHTPGSAEWKAWNRQQKKQAKQAKPAGDTPSAEAPVAKDAKATPAKVEASDDKKKAVEEKAEKKEAVAPELKKSEAEKKAVDPVDPKADEHKKISKEIDDKAKKQGDVKQGSADLDRLYAEAEHAYNELKSATAEIAGQTGGAAKFPPGLKGKERALEKINADYKGDASKLFDIARASIEFTSLDALYKALDMVQGRFTVVRIKDRFQSPTKSGYRDMLLNLKTSNGHICEMQLHVEQILAVKNGEGHKLYEETRSLEAKAAKENRPLSEQEKNQISAADGKAKTLYDNAYADSLKPGEKQPSAKADDKQAGKEPVDPKATEHKAISQGIDDKAKKQGDVKQSSADLDKLYQEAEVANEELRAATAEIAGATAGKPSFPPGLKGRKRAQEKIDADYKGDASKLFDIARASIEFRSLDDLYQALKMVEGRFTVVRIKDRFQAPTKSGYRDMLLNLKASNGHVVEMQLHVEQILAVKNGEGHKLYEETRAIEGKASTEGRAVTEEEKAKIDTANSKAKGLYDAAYADSLKPKDKPAEKQKAEADKADKKDGVAPELKQEAKKDPVDPKADEHKKISQQIDDKAKKQGEAKQGSADLDKLYAEAEHAYNELKGATAEIAGATGGAAKFPPGLKGRERALEKINADYKGDASKLFDIARASIEFTSLDALYKALDMVQGRFTVIRIKDRFQSPTKSGYRDMLLNLKTSNGHICEMQLHVEQILAVKNGEGHKLYEETRSIEAKAAKENRPLSEQEKSQVAAADGKAKTLYDNAYADSLKDKGGKKEAPKGEAAEAKAKIEKTVAKEPKPVKPPKDYPEPAVIDQKIDQSIGAGTQAGPNPVKKVAANPGLRKEHEGTGVEYAEMKGEAFVKGDGDKDEVDPNDVKQGSLGDCYLIGGMAAVARANPQYIKSLIKDNGDGTYDVTLYIKGSSWDSKGKPTVVTVDSKFPSGDKGFSAKYSKAGDKGPKGPELWVMLIEKAWAVHKGTYTGIEGGKVNDDGKFAGAIALLTNLNEGYYTPGSIDDKKLAAMIDEALKKGWPVACDSKNLDKEAAALKADADKAGVVGNHAYAPQKVDLQAMTVDLQNPWGSSHVPGLKIADFKRFYRGLRIGK